MPNRMTPEQVAGLRLPEGHGLVHTAHGWEWSGRLYGDSAWLAGMACTVANGHLPPAVLDWAWAHVDGLTVPTVEQWEAAEDLAELMRKPVGDEEDDAIGLADIISPPQPAPTPQAETPTEPRHVVDVFAKSRLRMPVVREQEKDCDTCSYQFVLAVEEPCDSCLALSISQPWTNWRPKP